ncbi:MAG: GTPase HflX [Betaproteobacteria bacterium]|nr:GTPase HflX [Betaproteobacteria bacterium]
MTTARAADPPPGPDPAAAVLVCLDFGGAGFEPGVEEITRLAHSAGARRTRVVRGRRQRPDARFFAGSGKVEEVRRAVSESNAGFVIFNHELSPAQQRNLDKEIGQRVLDRTDLILEIFAQRAQTREGKLQVELAQLQHAASRLVRGWTHLERQRGGLGKTGGPGEKQIELDRRMIAARMRVLRDKLVTLGQRRSVQRRARTRREVFSVALVGYTNAGKSTLFNALTHPRGGAYVADQLFATLDTTARKLWIEGAGEVVIADTVGFIRDLPHGLVAAFRATLEETVRADLLLHVIDGASPVREREIEDVNRVLAEIGAQTVPQIAAWNKIDLSGLEPGLERDEYGKISRVFVSALTGAGSAGLRLAIAEAAQPHKRAGQAQEPLPELSA